MYRARSFWTIWNICKGKRRSEKWSGCGDGGGGGGGGGAYVFHLEAFFLELLDGQDLADGNPADRVRMFGFGVIEFAGGETEVAFLESSKVERNA